MLQTSFRLLRQARACHDRYQFLREFLGAGCGDNTPIGLDRILEINGLDDALWALRAVREDQAEECDRLARIFICRCVRETPLADGRTVWDLLTDERSRQAVEVAERFVAGEATGTELDVAWRAAVAARDTVAAWRVTRRDVREAAWVTVRVVATGAAREAQRVIFSELLQG